MEADRFEPHQFASDFQQFLQSYSLLVPNDERPLHDLVAQHVGTDPRGLPSITEQLHPAEHPNLQLAMDSLAADDGGWEFVGLPGELRNYGGFSLVGLLSGRMGGALATPAPIEYMNVAVGNDETLPCVSLALYLARIDRTPIVVMIAAGVDHGPRQGLAVEVLAANHSDAARFAARLRTRMHEKNVYRGKVLSFTFSEFGRFGLSFHRLPPLSRSDIVLPEVDLSAIERHTVELSHHSAALPAAGRHLKRGLLLYGPPGTGKTLSVMYLCNEMPGRTTFLLTGPGTGALGQAVAMARSLQPAMVVLEDVDLVAQERTLPGMGTNPLLFQLLNEMDGLADDVDIIFILTTNRVDLLEPALAARPGRIDQAVEIGLPDTESRRRLFELYVQGVSHAIADFSPLVERTDGVSPAFIRELIRRATLTQAVDGGPSTALTTDDLLRALDDLLHRSAPITSRILGARQPRDA